MRVVTGSIQSFNIIRKFKLFMEGLESFEDDVDFDGFL